MKTALTILLIFSVIASVPAAYGNERLWPTDIYCGECVAPRILASKSAYVKEMDKKSCAKEHVGNLKEIQECEDILRSNKEVAFFTDRCGGMDDPFYIGLNGEEYELKRISGDTTKVPYLIGEFSGDGIHVKTKLIRLIKKTYLKGFPKTDDNIEEAIYEVLVTVVKGNITESIRGIIYIGL